MLSRRAETGREPAPSGARRSSRSLTARLAGLFAVLALCVLSLSTFVPYWLLTRQLAWEDEEALNQKADAVRQALLEYATQPDRLEAEVRQDVGSPGFRLYYVRVLDPSGRTLLASEGMASMLPPDIFPSAAADSGRAVTLRKVTPRGRSFLAETRRVRAGKPRPGLWWLQVAIDVTPEQALLGRYRVITLAVFIVALLFSAGGAVAVARWGLRPVTRITDMAERIGPHHLSERLGQVEWPAELAELASVFDGMLDRLQDSFERLSRFSADLAHELRTPLSNLMTEMEVTLARARSAERYESVLGSALEECGRLSHLVESLLFLARAESGRAALRPERVEVRREIETVTEFYRPLAEERRVSLCCRGSGTLDADPTLLRRALNNLLSNALEHTPPGGEVVVSAEATAGSVEIGVRDTGTGISAEDLPRVFDRFYRSADDRSSGHGGTGLGLSLVRSITRLHGGEVSIRSRKGEGTSVVLSLPTSPSSKTA